MSEVRAILYARVSKKSQAEGYSLRQQIERLREYANEQGYEVVEEIIDPGYSGTVLDRPGMDQVRDLVEAGGVDVVLAQDADRITRNPVHRGWLDDEFAKYGTRLVALDDWGDDSHEGQLLKFVKGWQAQGETNKTAERSRRNKRRKAREGKVVGGHHAAYGYAYKHDSEGKVIGYEVNEAEMQTVRRIFTDIARGKSIRGVKDALDAEYVPSPRGGLWTRQFIRTLISSDLYKPHSVEECRAMGVSETVLTRLDVDKAYGVYRFDDIPVPVPDAGIPLEVVQAARVRVENNEASVRAPSRAGDKVWELSGGILRCAVCDRALQSVIVKPREIAYHYYRCVGVKSGKADHCTIRTHVSAEKIEQEVWQAVSAILDDKEHVLRKLQEHFAQKRKELPRPGADAPTLTSRLKKIEAKRVKYQHAYAADALSLADLAARTAELDNEREYIERELERVANRDAELQKLDETEREMRERIEATDNNLDGKTSQEKRELYQDLRVSVLAGEDKKPVISGIFPTRIAGTKGTLWRQRDGRGYLYTASSLDGVSSFEKLPRRRCRPTPRFARP